MRSRVRDRVLTAGLVIVAACIVASCIGAAMQRSSAPMPLWYGAPAQVWMTDALPIGNGSLGAMLFGGAPVERVQFNVNSLWEGDSQNTGSYQAFGDVIVDLGHTGVSAYRRELDIDSAVHRVTYKVGAVSYKRLAFASNPAQVIVMRLTADTPHSHTGTVWLTDMHGASITATGNTLVSVGKLTNGLDFEARLPVVGEGGTVAMATVALPGAKPPGWTGTLPATSIKFDKCDAVTFVLGAGTSYVPDFGQMWHGVHPPAVVGTHVASAAARKFDDLLSEHTSDYQTLFRRFHLDLGSSDPALLALPTDQRLQSYSAGTKPDPGLEELVTQYGRYLLISSSRSGSLPANLQGLWNDSNTPAWRGDYHSDINVEMNYWPAEPTNLAECHVPFIDYVNSLRDVRKILTQRQYGATVRGWTVQTENNIYGGSSWNWNEPGSAWYAQDLFEHFAFGQDKTYLQTRAYPVLKEVCEFWQDRLTTRPDGTVVVPDGWSPEHGPRSEEGVSYDQELVYDVFTNFIESADALGVDQPMRNIIAGTRDHLLVPKVGSWGQLQEWEIDRDSQTEQHRHLSHLIALHPGRQISPATTPALAKAAGVALTARGDGATGWSRAWKINLWARMLDGDHAYKLLRGLISYTTATSVNVTTGGGLYPNLLDAHPPFQIDGNFGATAGVAEMLLQSQSGEISVLPALPTAWPTGSVSGLRARGGYAVDIDWSGGKLVRAVITGVANPSPSCKVRYGSQVVTIPLASGMAITVDGALTVK